MVSDLASINNVTRTTLTTYHTPFHAILASCLSSCLPCQFFLEGEGAVEQEHRCTSLEPLVAVVVVAFLANGQGAFFYNK